jgi:prepilin-type processing-associated H-X9-DG protein
MGVRRGSSRWRKRSPAAILGGMRGRAFTYIELLALLAIAGILLAIFIPYVGAQRETARQAQCADNLRQIRNALQEYADANHHDYPRVRYAPTSNPDGYTAFTGPFAVNPFAAPVEPNDVTASLWLLVRDGDITDLRVFVCPSSREQADSLVNAAGMAVRPMGRSNFFSAANLSYSYASPFSGFEDYHLNSDWLAGQFALMADKNPGSLAASVAHDAPPLELAKGNSLNHQRTGQNVLYADGSVSFEHTPYCGVGRDVNQPDGDNIYTALAAHPLTAGEHPSYVANGFVGRQFGPSYRYDSYLVPTEDDGQ